MKQRYLGGGAVTQKSCQLMAVSRPYRAIKGAFSHKGVKIRYGRNKQTTKKRTLERSPHRAKQEHGEYFVRVMVLVMFVFALH